MINNNKIIKKFFNSNLIIAQYLKLKINKKLVKNLNYWVLKNNYNRLMMNFKVNLMKVIIHS